MNREVFISYAKHDQAIANTICTLLEQGGVQCWIAPRDIVPGSKYGEAIVRAIEECQVLMLLLSEKSNRSPFVWREVECAVSRGRPIITLRLAKIVPGKEIEFFVGGEQWFDAFDRKVEEFLPELARCVRIHIGHSLDEPNPQSSPKLTVNTGPATSESKSVRVTGTTAGVQRTARELDMMLDGDEIELHIHPPGGNRRRIRISRAAMQNSFDQWNRSDSDENLIRLSARTSRKDAPITFAIYQSGEIELREEWWIRMAGEDLKIALQKLGVRAPW